MLIFLLLLSIGLGAAWYQGYPGGVPSQDAMVRCGVANDLLAGTTRGRQGLVGSLYWTPLPTLVVLPLLRVHPVMATGFAACAAAAASYALLCAFLNGWWAAHGLSGPLRFAALLAFFMSPPVLHDISRGSSNALFVLLGVATLCFLIEWWETDELRPLAYLSLVVALGMITRYQFAFAFVVVLLAIFLHLRLRGRGHFYAQGTLIIVMTPALYLGVLWCAANWLIMGDPFFFVRGLPWHTLRNLVGGGAGWRGHLGEQLADAGRTWLALVHEGGAWDALVLPCLLAILGWVSGRCFDRHRRLAAVPVLALSIALLCVGQHWWLGPRVEPTQNARKAVRCLESLGPNDAVLVSGYRGYELQYLGAARLHDRQHYVHTVSLYLDEALRRTSGKAVHLAVPPPTGANRWEDINIKFPRLYRGGEDFAIFEREVAGWRIMWLVRIDQPPK